MIILKTHAVVLALQQAYRATQEKKHNLKRGKMKYDKDTNYFLEYFISSI